MFKTTETKTSLSVEEKEQLAKLLERAESTDIKGDIWYEIVKKFITVPVELCVLDQENRVFLVYRKDQEFDGYHMPGTVVNDWETVNEARMRLVKGEVVRDAGFQVTPPESIGWLEVRRGEGPYENRTRNAVSLLHIAHLIGGFTPKEGLGFYPFDAIPENTLGSHKYLLQFFKRYLEDKRIILGN